MHTRELGGYVSKQVAAKDGQAACQVLAWVLNSAGLLNITWKE